MPTLICSQCLKPYEGTYYQPCDACKAEIDAHIAAALKPAKAKPPEVVFEEVCPVIYRDTDPARLPETCLAATLAWQFGPKGLILMGPTGAGKTRCAWLLLHRLIVEEKRQVHVFDCLSFSHECARRFLDGDGDEWVSRLAKADIVFFDDLGKLKISERVEAEFFGLVERRTSNGLPILATTNDTGETLAARMTDNRGPALIRRLREFCLTVNF